MHLRGTWVGNFIRRRGQLLTGEGHEGSALRVPELQHPHCLWNKPGAVGCEASLPPHSHRLWGVPGALHLSNLHFPTWLSFCQVQKPQAPPGPVPLGVQTIRETCPPVTGV